MLQKIEIWLWAFVDKNAPPEVKEATRLNCVRTFSPSGAFEQDDMDNWRGVTRSSLTPLARKYSHDLSMGLGRAGSDPDFPGTVAERYTSENNQRNFYRRWEEFMNAEDWADIPIEPVTADFEGTATLNG